MRAPDAPDVAHRPHMRDSHDHRGEHDGCNHHLDEFDEPVAERLQGRAMLRRDKAEDNAGGDGNQHLHVKIRERFGYRMDAQPTYFGKHARAEHSLTPASTTGTRPSRQCRTSSQFSVTPAPVGRPR